MKMKMQMVMRAALCSTMMLSYWLHLAFAILVYVVAAAVVIIVVTETWWHPETQFY